MDSKVTDIVNDKVIAALKAGTVPWVKPWSGGASGAPRNLFSKHRYRGINSILIGMAGYTSPFWATFKQISEHGGRVMKGEHSTLVVFWSFFKPKNDPEDSKKRIPVLRYYLVFNVKNQTEGLEKYLPAEEAKPAEPAVDESLAAAKAVVDTYMATGPAFAESDHSAYSPSADRIVMPPMASFVNGAEYYGTMFHEMVHSTGPAKRCDREDYANSRFGSGDYGREELVAEMGACYLCAEAGVPASVEQSAAYLQSWITAIKGDPMLVITAGGKASKAADFILGNVVEEQDEPAEPVAC